MIIFKEPKIHSDVEDGLPDDHPLAFTHISCSNPTCDVLVHSANNECMDTWIETGKGNFCLRCFLDIEQRGSLNDGGYGIQL